MSAGAVAAAAHGISVCISRRLAHRRGRRRRRRSRRLIVCLFMSGERAEFKIRHTGTFQPSAVG